MPSSSMRRHWQVGAALLMAAALGVAVQPAAAATYKWVDDKGVVHYSDKLPPEGVQKETTELTKEGVPLRRTPAALTPEQQRARAAEEERTREAQKLREITDRRDRALLASYTNEAEIDLARDRNLATIEASIKSAQAYVEQLGKRQAEVEAQRPAYRDKAFPVVLERELEGIAGELDRQNKLINQKTVERTLTIARYEADRARWRELKLAAKATTESGSGPAVTGTSAAAKPQK